MPAAGINIYARCRQRAGYTQEAWAEALDLSVESVRRYELWQRVPPMAVVADMVDLTGDQYLAYQHIHMVSQTLDVLPSAQEVGIREATIKLINRVLQFAEENRGKQLLMIAEDGVIDADERPLYEEIMGELRSMTTAIFEMKYSTEEVRV